MDLQDWSKFKIQLKERLKHPLPGRIAHSKMLPSFRKNESLIVSDNARESGVIILLYPETDGVNIVLIKRTEDGGKHSGQIALPGGKKENFDKDLTATALREAQEEVSLNLNEVEIAGQISNLYINVSNFLVTPIIGLCDKKPVLMKSDYEVDKIIYINLTLLFNSKSEAKIQIPSTATNVYWKAPVYQISDDEIIWGATAMILSEVEMIVHTDEN